MKRIIIAAAAALSLGLAACGELDTTAGGSGPAKAAKKGKAEGKTGAVGVPIRNAGTTYTVTDAKTKDAIGSSFLREKAKGTFVIVGLELTNNKNETKTFMDANVKLVAPDGDAYETSTDAAFSLKDDLMLEDIQPDLTTSGHIGFDIPPAKVPGSVLVIEDIWGNGEVTVDLGL